MKLKRILASILCVAMVLSTMSFAVFAEETNAVAKVGETYYSTLTEAMGKFNGRTVEVLCDIEEDIEGFWGVTLMTNVEGGVTITNTNTDWVDFDDVTVGAGVTVDIELPFSGDSENVILGTLVAGDTYYHGYDATTTIKDGGKVVVEGTTILRYNKNADSGIYIYGDSDDSTVEFDCGYYIGAYSGTFYVENANVEAGYVLFKNSYDADQNKGYADAAMMLDNSSITVAGTDDGQNSFQIDANTTLAMTNGSSIENVRDFNLLAGANLDLSMDASSTIAATNVSVAEDVPFDAVGNGDGTWSLVRVIAKIGDKKYETLTEALADATNGDTIVLYSNLDELATLVNSGNTFKGLTVQLGSDIDLNNEEWTPIGNSTYSFQGTFDGDGHTISNLLITGNKSNVGLFGFTTDGEIKNLTVENASVSGRLNVGVVAGTPYTSKYTNITVKGHVEVNGMAYVGAVGGKNAYANWTDITVDVDDTSYVYADSVEGGTAYRTYVGGVIGFMGEGKHTVKNVTSNIDVTGTVCDIGGIVGIAHYGNTFENVTCSGSVTNTNTNEEDLAETGAIAGVWHNQSGYTVTFVDCTYTGNSNVALVGAAYYASKSGVNTSGKLIVDGKTAWPAVAKINNTVYETLKDAFAAAIDGDTITVTVNIGEDDREEIKIDNKTVVIDLDGHSVNGAILPESTGNITVQNGSIVNKNAEMSAIEINSGKLALTNVNIESARHAVRIDGEVEAVIDGGTYKVGGSNGKTQHAINVSGNANVTIKNGTFIGPKGTTADSGAAVNVQAGATVTIEDGNFSGGKVNTLSAKGTLAVSGGLFDQNPAAYVADGYEAVATGEDTYLYSVEPLDAQGVKVEFVPTEEKNVYDIVLKSTSYQNIYEFVSAEFVFNNESTTVGNKPMEYVISGITTDEGKAITVVDYATDNDYDNDQFLIRIPDGAEEYRLTGTEITIGQVTFIGQATTQFQGNIKFDIERGKVAATERKTHLGYYYVADLDPATEDTLIIGDASIDSTVSEIKRNVAVNVAFNHSIDTENKWDDNQITVTLKNNFGYNKTQSIKIADAKAGATTFADVPLGQISVTLTAPGFRTYTYKTVVEETADNGVLVLNFWNDVKRNHDEVIEAGKTAMAHNFLVGDIVMDMTVDKYDLAAVTSYYGTYNIANNAKYLRYDLNRDGNIDIRDVQYVLHTMGN